MTSDLQDIDPSNPPRVNPIERTNRFWINDQPGPQAPRSGRAMVALVDEDAGGEIAYFLDGNVAKYVCRILNSASDLLSGRLAV